MTRWTTLFVACLALVLGIILGYALKPLSDQSAEPGPAPDFALSDLNGQSHELKDYQGRVLLMNFWATWCAPCLKEMPLLNERYQAHKADGFAILGPAIDDSALVAEFADKLAIQYPVSAGGQELFALMDAFGDTMGALPFSVLIDREGVIVARHWGELPAAKLDRWLEEHL